MLICLIVQMKKKNLGVVFMQTHLFFPRMIFHFLHRLKASVQV